MSLFDGKIHTSSVTESDLIRYFGPVVQVPAGSTDVQIQAAITQLTINDVGGVVQLQAGTYTLNNPVTLVSGVSIVGVPSVLTPSASTPLLANEWVPTGGTILMPGGFNFSGLVANTSGSPTWPAGGIFGCTIRDICFSGFTAGAIQIGSANNAGLCTSRLQGLSFYQCGSKGTSYTANKFALALYNFSNINVSQLYFGACANGMIAVNSTSNTGNTGGTNQGSYGVSIFEDIAVDFTYGFTGTGANFVRGFVLGADPANVQSDSFLDFMRVTHIQSLAFAGRSAISDTATWAGTGASFTVGTGTNFPVGMPVLFTTTTPTGVPENQYCFVTSQSGNTLQVALMRGGTALSNSSGATTATITQSGYPLFDFGGPTTAGSLSGVLIDDIISEGPGPGIYCENVVNGILHLSDSAQNTISAVLRNSFNIQLNLMDGASTDMDSNSANNTFLMGQLSSTQGSAPAYGTFYDKRSSLNAWVDYRGVSSNPQFQFNSQDGGWFQGKNSYGMQVTALSDANQSTIFAVWGGAITQVPSTARTLTLPTLGANYLGIPFIFLNTNGAGTTEIIAASGKLLGSGTAHTNITLAAGQMAYVVCVKDSNGTFWWLVVNTTGTYS
jgi:hypothetical protein